MNAIRNTMIAELLRLDDTATRDELDRLDDAGVQRRFNLVRTVKNVRLDGAPATRGDFVMTNLPAAVQKKLAGISSGAVRDLIAKIVARHPKEDIDVLKTKSVVYLTARVQLLKEVDRAEGRAEEAEALGVDLPEADLPPHDQQKKDSAMPVQHDAYGRIIPGTLHVDEGARADAQVADAAYQKSKTAMNASRTTTQGGSVAAPRADTDRADAGTEDAAYERSKANLNRSRADAGSPAAVAATPSLWVR